MDNYYPVMALSAIGGFAIGYSLPLNAESRVDILGVGIGLTAIAVSIPFNKKYRNHMHKSIDIYNGEVSNVNKHAYDINMKFSGTNLCLQLSF